MSERTIRTDLKVSPELAALLEAVKGHVMTPEERREQAISWVRGNLTIEDPDFPSGLVEQELAKLEAKGKVSFK